MSEPVMDRKQAILKDVLSVFARQGYRKTSMDELARAAGLSKQGLYLHFSSKGELFKGCITHYLDERLHEAQNIVSDRTLTTEARLVSVLNAWFGTHLSIFSPVFHDIIQESNLISLTTLENYKLQFKNIIASEIRGANQNDDPDKVITPEEAAQVLFTLGLSWKENGMTSDTLTQILRLGVKACLKAS